MTNMTNNQKKSNQTQNFLHKFCLREIRGSLQPHRRAKTLKCFNKIPGRLGFRLSSLTSEYVLQGGHVFLGFSKSGQFVISYSLHLEADEHAAYPAVYVYKLHWWHFVPNRTLKEISVIRLFGEQEIYHDLYIAFTEWPHDTSKVLIFGYSIADNGEERRQCYLTITAVPSIAPCKGCMSYTENEDVVLADGHPKCLRHGFAVHTKFELAPPYPFFLPKTHLKIDGVAVVNTGDTLIAMSVELDNRGNDLDDETMIVPSDFYPQELQSLFSDAEQMSQVSESLLATLNGAFFKTESQDCDTCSQDSQGTQASSPLSWREILAEKDRFCSINLMGHKSGSVEVSHSSHSLLNSNKSSQDSQNKNVQCDIEHSPTSPMPAPAFRTPSDYFRRESSTSLAQSENPFEDMKENKNNAKADQKFGSPDLCRLGGEINLSPCAIRVEESSTGSSCYSSPLIIQSDTQCFTFSIRRYVDIDNPSDAPIDMDDDLSLEYHSVLPLEVHGSAYNLMSTMSSNMQYDDKDAKPPKTAVVVKQLTFDIEQYLAEAIRSSVDLGLRYASFADYDAQILDVCPDTCCVIGMVMVLVRARPPLSTKRDSQGQSRYNLKVYQTGFKFEWNLTTGSYTTIDSEDFVEVDQKGCLRKSWRPGAEICRGMQKQFFIPQCPFQGVHVLSNEAVFKGQSVKTLIDPNHYVAIVL